MVIAALKVSYCKSKNIAYYFIHYGQIKGEVRFFINIKILKQCVAGFRVLDEKSFYYP